MSEFATETAIHSSNRSGSPDLRILHYNDVYHVEAGSREPVGGAARFQTIVNHYRSDDKYTNQPHLLTVFSGDAYNPSLESSVTKGRHMVPVLNGIMTDVACVGNHDLDFGVPQFRHLATKCTFPWLLGNVLDPALGEGVSLGGCKKSLILESSNGIKVGVVGLVEREWLDTINSLPPDLIYKSASATAMELIPPLREQGAEIIIAVTHMREPNDIKLATKTPPGLIDIILGGHDHFYSHQIINGTHCLRSGSDFKQLSYIEAHRKAERKGWDFSIIRRDITRNIPEDPTTVTLVDNLTSSLKSKLEKPIGYTMVPLDGRFTTVRHSESNLGNFVCDLMRFYCDADCAMMAAGTIRGDQVYPPGVLKMKDIMNCFPFEDPVVAVRVTGAAILAALENGVSKLPSLEGRFPHVSNIIMEFDPSLPEGSRITNCLIGGEPVELERLYSLATRGYMARGKDGYDSLLIESEGGKAEEVISEENGVLISTILRQYFLSLKVVGRWGRWGENLDKVWSGVQSQMSPREKPDPLRSSITTSQRDDDAVPPTPAIDKDPNLVDSDTDGEADEKTPALALDNEHTRRVARKYIKKWLRAAGLSPDSVSVDDAASVAEAEWTRGIAPRLEGRIVRVGQAVLEEVKKGHKRKHQSFTEMSDRSEKSR